MLLLVVKWWNVELEVTFSTLLWIKPKCVWTKICYWFCHSRWSHFIGCIFTSNGSVEQIMKTCNSGKTSFETSLYLFVILVFTTSDHDHLLFILMCPCGSDELFNWYRYVWPPFKPDCFTTDNRSSEWSSPGYQEEQSSWRAPHEEHRCKVVRMSG